jgi:hypothetical protein
VKTHWSARTECEDCDTVLQEVCFSAGHPRGLPLRYGIMKRLYFWFISWNEFTPHGQVKGKLCPDCGRIVLYGVPNGAAAP